MRTLECNKLHVHIGKKKKPELTSKKSAPPADNSKNSADRPLVKKDTKEKKAPLYEKLIPNEVEFSKLQVNTFSGLVERKKGNDISWDDVEMYGNFNDDTINMTLVGGQLKVPLEILPKWTIINAEVIVNEDTYEVKNVNLSLEKGGSAVLSGGGDIEGGNISAVADLKAIPIESLIENSEHAEIKGFINGEVKVVSENDETVTKGTLTLNEGALTVPKIANPVLRFLEINDGNEIQLDQCTADITHIDDLTIFENLDISVARTYKVRGNARLDDDTYTLRCHLGISPELHVRLPDNLAAKYEQKGSFYWISINESGNKDDIAIDLSKKAASALAASFLGDSDVFDKIGDALGEEVKDFLNGEKGEKLKKEGLKALENLFR